MLPSHETPQTQTPVTLPQQSPLILFPSLALADALENLAALMKCLCEIQHEHYGIHLMHRMIHDTLLYLSQCAQNAQGQTPPNA